MTDTGLCPHYATLARLEPPKLSQSVHREECTQCFDGQDTPSGVDVCLHCFNGACPAHHSPLHVQKMSHGFVVNVKRRPKPSAMRANDDAPPAKMTKLAISEEREEDKYDLFTVIKCWSCDPVSGRELPSADSDPKAKALVEGVMQSLSSARKDEVKAWEEEFETCQHTLNLEQVEARKIAASGLAHCTSCDLTTNLWLCLVCGALGCGRSQYGGVGGNGHGVAHYQATGHAVSVKLGTITPEGGADIYCYKCDDARLDPNLAVHLSTFGINVQTLSKTEKSMIELQIEQNLQYDFSLSAEDGSVEPLFGPGLTGLANLGNSCYIASTLQTLFSLPTFRTAYSPPSGSEERVSVHAKQCSVPLPAECVRCQLEKVADGLVSGRYAVPRGMVGAPPGLSNVGEKEGSKGGEGLAFQAGLKPAGLKALVGRGHAEFATMKQQDAEEFLGYLVQVIRRDLRVSGGSDPTQIFAHGMEQRLQCLTCNKVRYRVDAMDVVSVNIPAVPLPAAQSTSPPAFAPGGGDVDVEMGDGKDGDGKKKVEEKVRYQPVELRTCLDGLMGAEALEYRCGECARDVSALRQTRFATFPEVLVVHAKKFQVVGWVPTKLDIPVILPPDDLLEFGEGMLGKGIQPGEEALPEDAPPAPALPSFDAEAMAQLEGMGFPTIRCQKALLATGGTDAGAAMEWLFAHMEDPDIDDPIQPSAASGGGGGAPEPSPEQISILSEMGFTPVQARKALRETGGNAERAVEWLFNHPEDSGEEVLVPGSDGSGGAATGTGTGSVGASIGGSSAVPARYRLKAFVSHKGPSVHSGHYVAHVRREEGWVLFNDEKVVRVDEGSVGELKGLAYLYFFERV